MATHVNSIMTKKIVTIPLDADTTQAQELMNTHRIRHLPVLNKHGEIVGVLSEKDLLQHPRHESIGHIMSTDIAAVNADLPLRSAVLRMLEKKISCLLIENDLGEIMGIVTTDDLLWTLAHLLKDEKGSTFKGMINLETIGAVANQLSTMGI